MSVYKNMKYFAFILKQTRVDSLPQRNIWSLQGVAHQLNTGRWTFGEQERGCRGSFVQDEPLEIDTYLGLQQGKIKTYHTNKEYRTGQACCLVPIIKFLSGDWLVIKAIYDII